MTKKIHGAGGGSSGGGNQTVVVNQNVPVYNPTYTDDDPGLRSTSFAQLQFLICEGDIEGPAYGNDIHGLERSVFLDDTPIRVGSLVTPTPADLVFSYGRPNGQQTAVPGYNRIGAVTGVDTAVKYQQPVSQTVTASDPNATYYARVLLTFAGLVFQNNKGDVLGTDVALRIEYTDALATNRVAYNDSLSGKFSGQFQREFEFLLEGPAPWRITVHRDTEDDDQRNADGNTYRTNFNFSTIVAVIDQKLSYPYSSVLTVGLRADQYSNLPQVSVEMKGLKIEVPSNYDPVTRIYTGDWDGTFKLAYSNNPAWVLRDLIVQNRYGLGSYVSSAQVDKWTLYSIAQYCDQKVPAPNGTEEPRFTCNLVLQTAEEAWNVLQQLSSIFRGLLYYAGGRIVAIQDRPTETVFTFNESNTIEEFSDDGKVSEGNFKYSGAAKRARHTVVLASWDDPLDNYQPRVEYIADEEGIARFGYKAMDLRLFGVTSRGQALRAANWALLSEAVLDDTVTFRSNEIGAAVRPGDVVAILDPTKSARRYGGRIREVAGDVITLDDAPAIPNGGWAGSTFSYMVADAEGQPVLQERTIISVSGAVVTLVTDSSAAAPVVTFPWMVETADRTAQRFRVLTVEEQEDGIYAFTALRYRDDIYNTVDFDTPLKDNEDYLYTAVGPGTPTFTRAQIIWDNNQAKIDVEWLPASTNAVTNGFDLTVKEHRLQYQAGSLLDNGSILYDNVWRELERQNDNREQIPIDQYVSTDRFKVRVCAVTRAGQQSEWAETDVNDLQLWFPMPDLGGTHQELVPGAGSTDPGLQPNAVLSHLNQSTGSQLFTWQIKVPLPPYVDGVALSARPSRPLNDTEAAGLLPPDDDGWYFIANIKTDDYYAVAFHALVTWDVRINLTTSIPGITDTTYAYDIVDRAELMPPAVENFRVVVEGGAQSRVGQKRFSWELPENPPFIEKWPLARINDLAVFNVRYRQGTTPNWDLSFALFSDGIPGDQTWFETNLFDYGQWCVMIKPVDRTGWESDEYATITLGIGDPLPTNVVDRIDVRDQGFLGTLDNFAVKATGSGLIYPTPLTDPMYILPLDDQFYEGISGFFLEQIDPALLSEYTVTFGNLFDNSQLIIYTQADATYRWFLQKLAGSDADMYPSPLTDPFYSSDNSGLISTEVNDLITTDGGDHILAVYQADLDGLIYITGTDSGSAGWHPYAPNEELASGAWQARLEMISLDGTTKGMVTDVDFVLDYPDVNWQGEDVNVPAAGARVTFPPDTYRSLKAVSLTVQDNSFAPGVATNAVVEFKDKDFVDIRCLDSSGQPVDGVVDVFTVGY